MVKSAWLLLVPRFFNQQHFLTANFNHNKVLVSPLSDERVNMLLRVVGIMSLASGLMFAAIGIAQAVPVGPTAVSVPELDPANY